MNELLGCIGLHLNLDIEISKVLWDISEPRVLEHELIVLYKRQIATENVARATENHRLVQHDAASRQKGMANREEVADAGMVVAYEFAVASDGFDQRLAKYRSAKQCERFNLEWTKVVHMQPNV